MKSASGTPLFFTKSQGIGNDFVVVDLRRGENRGVTLTASRARALCDRRFGVGADQVLVLSAPRNSDASVHMEIWNADGSTAEMCGNGIRAVALELGAAAAVGKRVGVETLAGLKWVELLEGDAVQARVRVDMGEPTVGKGSEELAFLDQRLRFLSVDMGNPHAVFFVEDVEAVPLAIWGPAIEGHARFPARTNVEFVQVLSPSRVKVRVWERGAGATLACGTGACAVGVATAVTGRSSAAKIEVVLPGGELEIEWKPGQPVMMTGPATRVFSGQWLG